MEDFASQGSWRRTHEPDAETHDPDFVWNPAECFGVCTAPHGDETPAPNAFVEQARWSGWDASRIRWHPVEVRHPLRAVLSWLDAPDRLRRSDHPTNNEVLVPESPSSSGTTPRDAKQASNSVRPVVATSLAARQRDAKPASGHPKRAAPIDEIIEESAQHSSQASTATPSIINSTPPKRPRTSDSQTASAWSKETQTPATSSVTERPLSVSLRPARSSLGSDPQTPLDLPPLHTTLADETDTLAMQSAQTTPNPSIRLPETPLAPPDSDPFQEDQPVGRLLSITPQTDPGHSSSRPTGTTKPKNPHGGGSGPTPSRGSSTAFPVAPTNSVQEPEQDQSIGTKSASGASSRLDDTFDSLQQETEPGNGKVRYDLASQLPDDDWTNSRGGDHRKVLRRRTMSSFVPPEPLQNNSVGRGQKNQVSPVARAENGRAASGLRDGFAVVRHGNRRSLPGRTIPKVPLFSPDQAHPNHARHQQQTTRSLFTAASGKKIEFTSNQLTKASRLLDGPAAAKETLDCRAASTPQASKPVFLTSSGGKVGAPDGALDTAQHLLQSANSVQNLVVRDTRKSAASALRGARKVLGTVEESRQQSAQKNGYARKTEQPLRSRKRTRVDDRESIGHEESSEGDKIDEATMAKNGKTPANDQGTKRSTSQAVKEKIAVETIVIEDEETGLLGVNESEKGAPAFKYMQDLIRVPQRISDSQTPVGQSRSVPEAMSPPMQIGSEGRSAIENARRLLGTVSREREGSATKQLTECQSSGYRDPGGRRVSLKRVSEQTPGTREANQGKGPSAGAASFTEEVVEAVGWANADQQRTPLGAIRHPLQVNALDVADGVPMAVLNNAEKLLAQVEKEKLASVRRIQNTKGDRTRRAQSKNSTKNVAIQEAQRILGEVGVDKELSASKDQTGTIRTAASSGPKEKTTSTHPRAKESGLFTTGSGAMVVVSDIALDRAKKVMKQYCDNLEAGMSTSSRVLRDSDSSAQQKGARALNHAGQLLETIEGEKERSAERAKSSAVLSKGAFHAQDAIGNNQTRANVRSIHAKNVNLFLSTQESPGTSRFTEKQSHSTTEDHAVNQQRRRKGGGYDATGERVLGLFKTGTGKHISAKEGALQEASKLLRGAEASRSKDVLLVPQRDKGTTAVRSGLREGYDGGQNGSLRDETNKDVPREPGALFATGSGKAVAVSKTALEKGGALLRGDNDVPNVYSDMDHRIKTGPKHFGSGSRCIETNSFTGEENLSESRTPPAVFKTPTPRKPRRQRNSAQTTRSSFRTPRPIPKSVQKQKPSTSKKSHRAIEIGGLVSPIGQTLTVRKQEGIIVRRLTLKELETRHGPRRPPLSTEEFRDLSIPCRGLDRALQYEFKGERMGCSSLFDLLKGLFPELLVETVMKDLKQHSSGSLGVQEVSTIISHAFGRPAENPREKDISEVGSQLWIRNAYSLAVWKHACYEASFPKFCQLTFARVLLDIARRIDLEWNRFSPPHLLQMARKDIAPSMACVVVVCSKITDNEIGITDGYYVLKARLDAGLSEKSRSNTIFVGLKLFICGALHETKQGDEIDELSTCVLRLHSNGVRPAKWNAKLGCRKSPLVLRSLTSIQLGGRISSCLVIVQRHFEPKFLEKRLQDNASGLPTLVWRSSEGEKQALDRFQKDCEENTFRSTEDPSEIVERERIPDRDVTRVFEALVSDLSGNNFFTVQCWRSDESLEMAFDCEGCAIQLFNVDTSSDKYSSTTLSIRNSFPARKVKVSFDAKAFTPRSLTRISSLGSIGHDKTFDTVLLLVHIGDLTEHRSQRHLYFVDDTRASMLAVRFEGEDARHIPRQFKKTGVLGIMVHAKNLRSPRIQRSLDLVSCQATLLTSWKSEREASRDGHVKQAIDLLRQRIDQSTLRTRGEYAKMLEEGSHEIGNVGAHKFSAVRSETLGLLCRLESGE